MAKDFMGVVFMYDLINEHSLTQTFFFNFFFKKKTTTIVPWVL